MSRGNDKQKIFLTNGDRRVFIKGLAGTIRDFRWNCHAYCLMGNHYHILIETPEANLSEGMQQLNGNYCRYFAWKHKRIGHVVQGRFLSPLVENERHLFALFRYIFLNPVKEGMAGSPENWRWSSYSATAGLCIEPDFLTTSFVLGCFSDNPSRAREEFTGYVLAGLHEASSMKDQALILNSLLKGTKDAGARNDVIRSAIRDRGFSVAGVAGHLGVHPATIYRALKD